MIKVLSIWSPLFNLSLSWKIKWKSAKKVHERHKKECSLYQQKLFCHVAITKKNTIKSLYSNSLPSRHYLKVVTTGELGHCLRVSRREVATPSGVARLLPEKFRWELVIRGSRFWDWDFSLSLTLRSLCAFLLFLRGVIRASVYERTQKICLSLSLITSSPKCQELRIRASRMGANY